MLVVLDTNILVSALLSPHGKPARILKLCLNGDYTLCLDERIFLEYENVLARPKFHFNPQLVNILLSTIRHTSVFILATSCEVPFVDESDKKFYEVAKTCNATLITGNLKHYPTEPFIKSVQDI